MRTSFFLGLACLWGLGCSAFDQCAEVSPGELAALPARLSETGLFDPATLDTHPEVRPYAPAFELWSDGAKKRRFIRLPPGQVIDTSDLDEWRFPRGTRLWKELTRDGVRVETRLLLKTGDGDADWVGAAYVWRGSDAVLPPPAGQRTCWHGTRRPGGGSPLRLSRGTAQPPLATERVDEAGAALLRGWIEALR